MKKFSGFDIDNVEDLEELNDVMLGENPTNIKVRKEKERELNRSRLSWSRK